MLVAFNYTDGTRLWSRSFSLLSDTTRPWSVADRRTSMPFADTSVALANGKLYFACLDGRLYVMADS